MCCIISVAILSLPGLTEKLGPEINKSQCVRSNNCRARAWRKQKGGGAENHKKTMIKYGNKSGCETWKIKGKIKKIIQLWIMGHKQKVWAVIYFQLCDISSFSKVGYICPCINMPHWVETVYKLMTIVISTCVILTFTVKFDIWVQGVLICKLCLSYYIR